MIRLLPNIPEDRSSRELERQYIRAYYQDRLCPEDVEKCDYFYERGGFFPFCRAIRIPMPRSDEVLLEMLARAKPKQPWWWLLGEKCRRMGKAYKAHREARKQSRAKARLQRLEAAQARTEIRMQRLEAGRARAEAKLQQIKTEQAKIRAMEP